jgi:pyruvate/2-oxoglutarate dehydrogenase complex dihydrolipoamide acyltransferase (E2) component
MRSPILMPDVTGPESSGEPPILCLWFAQPGDQVYAGDRLAELLLDGTTFDVSSPGTGTLAEKNAWPGERLAPGQILGWIVEDP